LYFFSNWSTIKEAEVNVFLVKKMNIFLSGNVDLIEGVNNREYFAQRNV
jgi:hypothetical protein